jgi:hypothetical protein
MSFVFLDDFTFDWPVTVRLPKAGDHVEQAFTATFRLIEDDAFFAAPADSSAEALVAAEYHRLERILIGWSGITGPDGDDVAYSLDARDRLIRIRPVREALVRAYSDAVFRGGLREKN